MLYLGHFYFARLGHYHFAVTVKVFGSFWGNLGL